jgi:hypothetical protein
MDVQQRYPVSIAAQAQLVNVARGLAQMEMLISYCARVRERLQTFDLEEKRMALQALAVQVTWAIDQPWQVKGSLPLEEGVILSSTTGRGIYP